MILKEKITAALFGVAIGDALGVPFEFLSRSTMQVAPATDMVGYGTHHQPAGTFSDDSSLTFCLAEMLSHNFSLSQLGDNFVKWLDHGYWTANGDVFDVGNATHVAIGNLRSGVQPAIAGGNKLTDNGNGSLMRILPLAFYLQQKTIDQRFELTKQVSSLTHRHNISITACFYYLEFALALLTGEEKYTIYKKLKNTIPDYLAPLKLPAGDIEMFNRLFIADIFLLDEDDIKSSGFVLHTLEASIWCLLKTDSYQDAVLSAVNLGEDTDTTAAVTGGLAGILYGLEGIPTPWMNAINRKDDIQDLVDRLYVQLNR